MDGIRRSKRKTEPKGNQNIVEKDCSKKSASDSVIQSSVSVKKPSQNASQAAGSICSKKALRKIRTLGTFVIDCEEIIGEKTIDTETLKTYLLKKIKVGGKHNDKRVKVEKQGMKISISADVFIEKTYIKYLLKIYLRNNQLNEWIRVVNGKKSYSLQYIRRSE